MSTDASNPPRARRGSDADRWRRPTSADVARATGLSRATVSYVLNDAPHQVIPEHTRQRVLEAARRLGYSPSAAARALRRGRWDVVLCLLPDWPIGNHVATVMYGLSSVLAGEGVTLVIHPRSPGDRPAAEVWKSMTPAAVITFEELADSDAAYIRNAGTEFTLSLTGAARGGTLRLPGQRAGRLQAQHLAATGHRHLGYAYPDDPSVDSFAGPRLDGVRLACADLGLADPLVRRLGLDVASAADAVAAWTSATPAVTGVCAYNDETAFAVIAGARQLGASVPEDLAVIGVDNIPLAPLAHPPLTTVATDPAALAAHVARTILAGLADDPPPRGLGSDIHEVIVRQSA